MIELLKEFIDILLHIDIHLHEWVTDYRMWTYLILFTIIFLETGFVITPFLPGDSLLFAAGAIAAMDGEPLSIGVLVPILILAAYLGDTVNYFIGKSIGHKVYEKNYRLIKREYLDRTHAFYEKHGGKTIIIARFMPIIRTFAPFVAGIGTMRYGRFTSFNIIGGVLWVVGFCVAGYFFGNIPVVKRNFTIVIFVIILLSVMPMVIAFIQNYLNNRKAKP